MGKSSLQANARRRLDFINGMQRLRRGFWRAFCMCELCGCSHP
jgi:hypothetical protein